MAGFQQGVPELLTRRADDNLEYSLHQVHCKGAPDADVNSDIDEHIPFFSRRKYPQVL